MARRPDLWPVAARLGWRLTRRRPGARRPPGGFGPSAAYRRFRLETMYGDPDATLRGADLVAYLDWCRRMEALAR